MKKTLSIILLVSVLSLVSGPALAETEQGKPEATAKQQACIKAAQDKRSAALKTAKDALDSNSKAALKTKQDAIKKATDAFNLATKAALKTKQNALAEAEKIANLEERAKKIKEANDAYNNNKTVQAARGPQIDAIKAANEAYDQDETVAKVKPAYAAAVKAANDQFQIDQKACIEKDGAGKKTGFFKKIGNSISGFFSKIWGFFRRNK